MGAGVGPELVGEFLGLRFPVNGERSPDFSVRLEFRSEHVELVAGSCPAGLSEKAVFHPGKRGVGNHVTDRGTDRRSGRDLHVDCILVKAESVTSGAVSRADVLVGPGVPVYRTIEITAVAYDPAAYLPDPFFVEKTFPLGEKPFLGKGYGIL